MSKIRRRTTIRFKSGRHAFPLIDDEKPNWMKAKACSRHLLAEDFSSEQCCVASPLMRCEAPGLAPMCLDMWDIISL